MAEHRSVVLSGAPGITQEYMAREEFDTSRFGNHVVQLPSGYSLCLGCQSCELLCGTVRDGKVGLNRSCLHVQRGGASANVHTVLTCQQCIDHPCYEACPRKDEAMCVDGDGIVYVVEEECIGCGLCAKACKFSPSRIAMVGEKKDRKAHKCDLCRNRPEGPVCIEFCPALCLGLASDVIAAKEA